MNNIEDHILYEKDGLLVVDKPYDLPSTGRSLEDADCLQFWLIKRQGGMVWAIHQLDADTSGVNIFVTRKELVPIYKSLLEKTNSDKEYIALVHGSPTWNECEEFGPIGKVDERSLGVTSGGKTAHSNFTILDRADNHSLVKVNIFTGRTHQIRIHLSHLGHPVVGDDWYCKPPCKEHIRQALHCHKIHLIQTDKTFTASLPKDLEELFKKLRLSYQL